MHLLSCCILSGVLSLFSNPPVPQEAEVCAKCEADTPQEQVISRFSFLERIFGSRKSK